MLVFSFHYFTQWGKIALSLKLAMDKEDERSIGLP